MVKNKINILDREGLFWLNYANYSHFGLGVNFSYCIGVFFVSSLWKQNTKTQKQSTYHIEEYDLTKTFFWQPFLMHGSPKGVRAELVSFQMKI